MQSNLASPSYPPYSPHASNSNASQSPWSASSNTGSGYESLTLPPINSDNYNYNFDFDNNNNNERYFDPELRNGSPELFIPEPPSQPPPSNQQARQEQPPPISQYRISESPDPFDEFIVTAGIEDPSRRPSPSYNTTRASSVVDLTESSPPPNMAPTTRKRKAETPGEGPSAKSRRTSLERRPPSRQAAQIIESSDVVDLVDVEDDAQYVDFKAKQHAEVIKQQREEEANKPIKLAEFQCIICMDNPTDLTVTHCGHLFCGECLHQALYAGNAKKLCPVCRTAINTTMVGKGAQKKQPKNGFYTLELKLMTSKKQGKQRAR